MNKLARKIKNPSHYWTDFEGELSAYYNYVWTDLKSHNEMFNFIRGYIEIATKYKIAVPINDLSSIDTEAISLYPLYQKDNDYFYPTFLFINDEDRKAHKIVSVDPLISIEDSFEKLNAFGSIPIRVELFMRNSQLKLLCHLDNDIFNSWIDNKKTKRDPEIGGKNLWVDNSDLAYLNTPRLNSFLRDLKKLCFEYGANEFEFENLGLIDFCEDGVMFDGTVVYYEDIVDLLEPHHRIV